MGEEVLFEIERVRLTRVGGPGSATTAVRKEYLGPESAIRARHESTMLSLLSGLSGVPTLLAIPSDQQSILMSDVAGISLATLLNDGPLDVATLLGLAADLAEVIAAVHSRGVVHRDINPRTILLHGSPRHVMLVDFERATATDPHQVHPINNLMGALAYLAPEQTGRTGWTIDHRSDLYAFGATLYEMATGAPPFGNADPLRLTHGHLTQVPTNPATVVPAIPPALSAIIMRLLEKEPNRRYQSAHGVRHDLMKLISLGTRRMRVRDREPDNFTLGERDFPDRLTPPSRLVGRDAEIKVLSEAFAAVATGDHRTVLIAGEPGVGKTSLMDTLRPLVSATRGWFLAGTCNQYAVGLGPSALRQAIRNLARMLLAEPEVELGLLRKRLRDRMGANASLLVAAEPRLEPILGIPSGGETPADPALARRRLHRAIADLLIGVASLERPIVLFLDDVHWADSGSMEIIDMLRSTDQLNHMLLIYAYRESDSGGSHPLQQFLLPPGAIPERTVLLRLTNFHLEQLQSLLGQMLRLPASEVTSLATFTMAAEAGNPFRTVELVNALRRDQLLVLGDEGWAWAQEKLAERLAPTNQPDDVVRRLTTRIMELPAPSRMLIEILACLGGSADLSLLRVLEAETGLPRVLSDGLLVMDLGSHPAVRFAHDWIHQATRAGMSDSDRHAQMLGLARRLANHPDYPVLAADQYLGVISSLDDPAELRSVVPLLRLAAERARLAANFELVDCYLAAALCALNTIADDAHPDSQERLEIDVAWHAALYALGKSREVDEVYARIRRHPSHLLLPAMATWAQISSLTNRGDIHAALELGLAALAELGLPAPNPDELASVVERGLNDMVRWAADPHFSPADQALPAGLLAAAAPVRESTVEDPWIPVVGRILGRLVVAAYFCASPLAHWLTVEAFRLWIRRGPHPALVSPLVHTAAVMIARRQDYSTGHTVVRRILATCETMGFLSEMGQARQVYASSAGPWFEPLEQTIRQAHHAREELLQAGDVQYAGFACYSIAIQSLDCQPTLAGLLAEVNAGLALSARTGNDLVAASLVAFRQSVRALQGHTRNLASADDADFSEAEHVAAVSTSPTAGAFYHLTRGFVGLLFNLPDQLHQHVVSVRPLLGAIAGTYGTTMTTVLLAMDAATRLREGRVPADERVQVRGDLTECANWLAQRAATAPENYQQLSHLIEAEIAWLEGDIPDALRTFDCAQREAASRSRPWHRALITERLARCQLANEIEYGGRLSLREARNAYRDWGATAKVEQLDREYPFLRTMASIPNSSVRQRSPGSPAPSGADTVDMLAVLRASQALSSETNLVRLQERIAEVLRTLTGATAVTVVTWNDDAAEWFLPSPGGRTELSLAEAAAERLLPLSVFRYAERTGEPLLVEDATRDDRFCVDPYLRDLEACALMVVPIRTRGRPRVMLLLENRHSTTTFTVNRLDAVMLLAGQLSVSLDNALLYADLESRVAARTVALEEVNHRLEHLVVTDPLTGLANRRQLTDRLGIEWRNALRWGAPIGMAMIDIDHFKLYNDHYGHLAGDHCLRRVAETIDGSTRDTDLLARYGGEEFAIILPGANNAVTYRVAERIRRAIIDRAEPHALSPQRIVTISIGTTSVSPTAQSGVDHLLEAADLELYRAKSSGRNTVSGGGNRERIQGQLAR